MEQREKVIAALTLKFGQMGRVFEDGQAEDLVDTVLLALGLGEGGENVIVPKEPTDEMLKAARRCDWWLNYESGQFDPPLIRDAYRAMLGARP